MTSPSRKTLLGNAASLAAIGWIYGGDLLDALRARGAEVAAFGELPSASRPAEVLVLAAGTAAVTVWGLLRRKPEGFKGYRLPPILLVGALFVDLVFAESRVPIASADMASMSLQRFQEAAQQLATPLSVPADPRVLQSLLAELGRPPYLQHGQPVGEYTLQVREDCQGPVREAPGLRPGTLLYCVAPERKGAWVTLVGLPVEKRFGTPEVLSAGGEPRFVLVRPHEAGDDAQDGEGDAFRDGSGLGLSGVPDGGGPGAASVQP
ncbi:hypothetical protein DRW03_04700 [Corallococcus sp. H22C18031201]|uniref:hypothetical protein n=1 Tax=Citreicoccus inhibens TaxID=2849499 RepID=UPI000E73CC49|nr:hypothetical protein [Citreicoccus inhibens]MBU8899303.1 hypothetical protein [Citreicoccus inhibens]RJS25780.1 hypothetical protein DRW03_04700 [Corallococcus sp. H22C18031201]